MRTIRASDADVPRAVAAGVATLVISQHEAVRRQLVTYLGRSPALVVSGDTFSPAAIIEAHPDVLVLDLSQLGHDGLRQAIDAAQRVGAHLIALASMHELADERAVTGAGGLYRLKSAGADRLADVVRDVATPPAAASAPCEARGSSVGVSADRRRSRPTPTRTIAHPRRSRPKDR